MCIRDRSGCNYLEDLITCVHIIQLKVLTCIRVGNKQKKIDISIPKLDHFLHKVYIHAARKVYTNVYLFEKKISELQVQKNNRELEILVQESILTTIRESIPTESIIRAYLDESMEIEQEEIIEPIVEPEEEAKKTEEEEEKEKEENKMDLKSNPENKVPETVPSIANIDNDKVITRLSFNDVDQLSDGTQKSAPKDVETLEQISLERSLQRQLEEEDSDDEDKNKIKIHMDENVTLDDIFDLDKDLNASVDSLGLDAEDL